MSPNRENKGTPPPEKEEKGKRTDRYRPGLEDKSDPGTTWNAGDTEGRQKHIKGPKKSLHDKKPSGETHVRNTRDSKNEDKS